MSNGSVASRQELVSVLGKILGDGPLSPAVQIQALGIFAALVEQRPAAFAPSGLAQSIATHARSAALSQITGGLAAAAVAATPATAIAGRRLVYVHGICKHVAGFSNDWWTAMQDFATDFGAGTLNDTRLEVVWSDVIGSASNHLSAARFQAAAQGAAMTDGAAATEQKRQQAANEIKEALLDRADQHVLSAAFRANATGGAAVAAVNPAGLISLPGVACVEDFSIYLADDAVRQQIIDRFTAVVKPELDANHEIDIIAHSWGTVVAYEGLRQLEDAGLTTPLVRNLFTVGAALSIGPVKSRLRPQNQDGRKPASVRRWVNLDAHGDIVGGPLQGRPFNVDFDLLNLDPFGCGSLFGLVRPSCAHGSYFKLGNLPVNRDIFGQFIEMP